MVMLCSPEKGKCETLNEDGLCTLKEGKLKGSLPDTTGQALYSCMHWIVHIIGRNGQTPSLIFDLCAKDGGLSTTHIISLKILRAGKKSKIYFCIASQSKFDDLATVGCDVTIVGLEGRLALCRPDGRCLQLEKTRGVGPWREYNYLTPLRHHGSRVL